MNRLIKFLIILLISNISYAAPRIDITKGNIEPFPVAINDLGSNGTSNNLLGQEIATIVKSDLARSGLFKIISNEAFIEEVKSSEVMPQFASWRQINAGAFLAGDLKKIGENDLEIAFRVWDSYSEKMIGGYKFTASEKQLRRIAHKIADEIYKSVTGEEGYFNTKIAYIAEYGNPHRKTKRLAVMDHDGANSVYLTNGKNLVLTPRFSPDATKIIYMSYELGAPKVFLYDVFKKSHSLVGHFPGMSFAPRFSPNAQNAVMSVTSSGNTGIYSVDLQTLKQTRLTGGAYIDTSPYYSPQGNKIIFSSDRSGGSQLYVMDIDGSNQQRISFGQGSYYTPAWSPRGDFIAFAKKLNGNFHIGIMRPDGSGERILTEGYMVEGPSWSPNGRVILFTNSERSKRGKAGSSTLQSIDLTGYHQHVIEATTDASDPNWSPLLQ